MNSCVCGCQRLDSGGRIYTVDISYIIYLVVWLYIYCGKNGGVWVSAVGQRRWIYAVGYGLFWLCGCGCCCVVKMYGCGCKNGGVWVSEVGQRRAQCCVVWSYILCGMFSFGCVVVHMW